MNAHLKKKEACAEGENLICVNGGKEEVLRERERKIVLHSLATIRTKSRVPRENCKIDFCLFGP